MESNEKVIDISDTSIGNYGAMCVAAVITLCDQLQEIRLRNCEIKDEGAINLFEELKSVENISILDLSNNMLTDKILPNLITLLQSNKKI